MRHLLVAIGAVGVAVVAACSSSSDSSNGATSGENDAGVTGEDGSSSTGAKLSTRVQVTSSPQMALLGGNALVGNSGVGGLESLRQYITQIYICETLDIGGTRLDPSTGHCLTVYDNPAPSELGFDPASPDFVGLATRAAATETGYVDLMNATSRAALSRETELRLEHAHAYKYGYITWVPAIKFRASLQMSDGSRWYSHPGTPTTMTAGGFTSEVAVTTTPFTTAPAEDAVVVQTNGGTFFRFQNPLVITEGDINNRRNIVLDLAFSPDGLVRAGNMSLINGNGQVADGPVPTTEGSPLPNVIAPPFLAITPVPHQTTEHTQREVYSATVSTGGESFEARIELYTIAEDPNHTIYGVNTKTLNNAGTIGRIGDFQKVFELEPDDVGSVRFEGQDNDPLVEGFVRTSTLGGSTTATLYCSKWNQTGPHGPPGAIPFDACPDDHKVNVTFTLVAKDLL